MAQGVDIKVWPGEGGGWASFGPKKRNDVSLNVGGLLRGLPYRPNVTTSGGD